MEEVEFTSAAEVVKDSQETQKLAPGSRQTLQRILVYVFKEFRSISDCVSCSESSADLIKLLVLPHRGVLFDMVSDGGNAGKRNRETCRKLNPDHKC